LAEGGRYIVLSLGNDLLPVDHTDAINHVDESFKAFTYKNP
jgi:hypothetical protein